MRGATYVALPEEMLGAGTEFFGGNARRLPRAEVPASLQALVLAAAERTEAATGLYRFFANFVAGGSSYLPEATAQEGLGELEALIGSSEKHDESIPHAGAVRWIEDITGLSQSDLAELLGVSRQTLHLWKQGGGIKPARLQRLIGVQQVLERASDALPSRQAFAAWLYSPRGIDSLSPWDLLRSGQVDRARVLAVARPRSVRRTRAWARNPAPEAFRDGREHRREAAPPDSDG
jgi:transcriptional regulator with XRE-family HTH domain